MQRFRHTPALGAEMDGTATQSIGVVLAPGIMALQCGTREFPHGGSDCDKPYAISTHVESHSLRFHGRSQNTVAGMFHKCHHIVAKAVMRAGG